MNHITISGNLTREPESRSAGQSEYSVISFSIANNDERRKNQDGSYDSVASFFDCEYWTKNPQYWLQQLYKGTSVVVSGTLKQDIWTDKQSNEKRSKVKIKLLDFPIIAARKTEVAPPQSEAPATGFHPAPKPPINDFPGPEQFDDDIPF
jgi:single-strand DNA-binding protein